MSQYTPMQTAYTTIADDILDRICFNRYGSDPSYTERVLEANPFLVDYGTHLPAGLIIEMPEIETTTAIVTETVQLWT